MQNLQLIREIPDDITSISVSGNMIAALNSSGELFMASAENMSLACTGRKNSTLKLGIDYVGLENSIKGLNWDFDLNTVIEKDEKYSSSAYGVFTKLGLSENDSSIIKFVSVGSYHTVASTSNETVYSWGENKINTYWALEKKKEKKKEEISGQLGFMKIAESIPKKMEGLNNEHIISLSCGENHTSVLTDVALYTCGNNGPIFKIFFFSFFFFFNFFDFFYNFYIFFD